jgi:hypothetical protein
MTGKIAIFGTAIFLAHAASTAFAEDAPAATPADTASATAAKHYPISLKDITLIGIGKVGDSVSVTIEMPANTMAGKDAGKARRTFKKGAKIPGSGYVIQAVGADSITLERDGKTEILKVSNGGATAVDSKNGQTGDNPRRRGFGRRGPPSGTEAISSYQKMTAEERQAAKKRLEAMKQFMDAAKKMQEAEGADANPRHKEMMAKGEAYTGKISDAYALIDQIDAAKAANDAAKEKELTQSLDASQKALEEMDAQRKAEFEKFRQERAQERQNSGGDNGGGNDAPPPPPPAE